jgi:hypothetical protein
MCVLRKWYGPKWPWRIFSAPSVPILPIPMRYRANFSFHSCSYVIFIVWHVYITWTSVTINSAGRRTMLQTLEGDADVDDGGHWFQATRRHSTHCATINSSFWELCSPDVSFQVLVELEFIWKSKCVRMILEHSWNWKNSWWTQLKPRRRSVVKSYVEFLLYVRQIARHIHSYRAIDNSVEKSAVAKNDGACTKEIIYVS